MSLSSFFWLTLLTLALHDVTWDKYKVVDAIQVQEVVAPIYTALITAMEDTKFLTTD